MKSMIIVVLFVALVGGAFLSRPSKASFDQYIQTQPAANQTATIKGVAQQLAGQIFVSNDTTFTDDYVFTTVQRSDKSKYIGAFGHWWKSGTAA